MVKRESLTCAYSIKALNIKMSSKYKFNNPERNYQESKGLIEIDVLQ
jgi:hypothetical protein